MHAIKRTISDTATVLINSALENTRALISALENTKLEITKLGDAEDKQSLCEQAFAYSACV
jgi:hypothetical protein